MRFTVVLALLGWASLSQAAFPTNTNVLSGRLNTCETKIQSDIDCVTSVKEGLEKIAEYIDKVRSLKNNMVRLQNGFTGVTAALSLAKYVPKIGAVLNILKHTINVSKRPLNSATTQVKRIDAKIYRYKNDVNRGIAHCDQVIAKLELVQQKCVQGNRAVSAARNCITAMGDGNVKQALGNSMETLANAVNRLFSDLNAALGRIGNTCSAIRRVTDLAKRWPNLNSIISGINGFYNKLKPIINFFNTLRNALNKRLCMKNPAEVTAEGAKKVAEAARRAAEKARELIRIRIRLPRIRLRGFKKRKRALSKREANTMLAIQKRGDICFSVQNILDGVNSVFGFLINLANKAIEAIMRKLPSFSLPGLPNFGNLFRFNLNFNLPRINFGLNIGFFDQFRNLRWDCGVQVKNACAARNSLVSFNCARPLG